MGNQRLKRRKLLAVGGASLGVGFAGCSDDDQAGMEPTDGSVSESDPDESEPDITSYQEAAINDPERELAWIESSNDLDVGEMVYWTQAALAGYRPGLLEEVTEATTGSTVRSSRAEEVPPVHRGFDTTFRYQYTINEEVNQACSVRIDPAQRRIFETGIIRLDREWSMDPWRFGLRHQEYISEEGGYKRHQRLDGTVTPNYGLAYPNGLLKALEERMETVREPVGWLSNIELALTNPEALSDGSPFIYTTPRDYELEKEEWEGNAIPSFNVTSAEAHLGDWIPVRHITLEGVNEDDEPVTATFDMRAGNIDIQQPEWLSIAEEET